MDPEDSSSSCILSLLPFLAVQPDYTIFLSLLLLVVLLLFSALISGSEVAFFTLSQSDMREYEEEESISSRRIRELKNAPRRLLATILIANNFINIAIVIISDFIIWNLVSEETFLAWSNQLIEFMNAQMDPFFIARTFNFLITVLGVTFFTCAFWRGCPKSICQHQLQKVSKVYVQALVCA